MIREIGATMAGLLSALAVFILAASAPLSVSRTQTTFDWSTLTKIPQTASGEAQRFYLPGTSGAVSGIAPALILVLIALLTSVLVSRFVSRAARSGRVT